MGMPMARRVSVVMSLFGVSLTTPLPQASGIGAEPVAIVRYDIADTAGSGFGCWSHYYTGTVVNTGRTVSGSVICGDGGQVANYSAGGGTLNDSMDTGSPIGTHLFTTRLADDGQPIAPVITLYLGATVTVQSIRVYGGNMSGNAIPGALDGVTVEFGGTAEPVTTTPVGAPNAIGVPSDDLIDLTGTPLAGILTDRIVLKNFTSSFFGFAFDQFSIAEIVVSGSPAVFVSIDIKPGTYPNSINVGKNGKIAVGILSTSTFDAVRVIQSSLTFGRTGNENSFVRCIREDVNKDKRLDLVCHFDAQSAGFQMGDTQGVLKGTTIDGLPIVGMDSVDIVR